MARRYRYRARRRKTRRVRFRRKRRFTRRYKKYSSTQRLWSYVKKATRSEVKKADFLDVYNTSYTNAFDIEALYTYKRMLSTLEITNLYVAENINPAVRTTSITKGLTRFLRPFYVTFTLPKGSAVNNRIGDSIFLKYLNFKITSKIHEDADSNVGASLYLAIFRANGNFDINSAAVLSSIWNNIYDISNIFIINPFLVPIRIITKTIKPNSLIISIKSSIRINNITYIINIIPNR